MIDLVCFSQLVVNRITGPNNVVTGVTTYRSFSVFINPEKVVTVTEGYPGIERDRPMTCITFADDESSIIVGATLGETVHRLRGDTL